MEWPDKVQCQKLTLGYNERLIKTIDLQDLLTTQKIC